MSNDLSDLKVGDKCWSIQLGDCEIEKVRDDVDDHYCPYYFYCENEEGDPSTYYKDGKSLAQDKVPSLYRTKPDWAKVKVKKKVEKDVWVSISSLDGLPDVHNCVSDISKYIAGKLTYFVEVEE